MLAAVRAGATGYLVKGVAADQVVSAVTAAVASGHAVFGPSLAARMLGLLRTVPPAQARFPQLSARERRGARPIWPRACPTSRSPSGW